MITAAGERIPLLTRLGLHRPELRAWAMYDWANSAFQSTIITAVFPPFFIDYAAQPGLDGAYTVYGKLTEGRDVLDRIAPGEPPAAPTIIQTIEIEER